MHKFNNLKGFKMSSLNINSLLRHVDEVRLMFPIFEIDVFAVNESKIDRSVTDSEICIPGTLCFVDIAIDLGFEWLLIYIREDHSFYKRNSLNLKSLKMIGIEICKQRSRPSLISAWYRAPNSEMKILHSLEIFLNKCDAESMELFISLVTLTVTFLRTPS